MAGARLRFSSGRLYGVCQCRRYLFHMFSVSRKRHTQSGLNCELANFNERNFSPSEVRPRARGRSSHWSPLGGGSARSVQLVAGNAQACGLAGTRP
jgi:hypothetical protein